MPPKSKNPEPESEEDEEIEDEEEVPKKSPIEVLNDLPLKQRKAVYALKDNHAKVRAIRQQQDGETKALEMKYMSFAAPLFEERRKIVNGEREVTDAEVAQGEQASKATSKVEAVEEEKEEEETTKPRRGVAAAKSKKAETEEGKASEPGTGEGLKGIPDFWLTAITNNEVTMDSVTPRDREALSALQDVTFKYIDDDPFKGYELGFIFGENRFFTDKVLTKRYIQERENDEPILARTEGTKINWKSKKDNLTVIIKTKQQKHRTKKTVRTVEQEVKCDSFFNFFDPPRIPQEDDDPEEEEDDIDFEELEERIEYDYEVGNTFKDRIIPRAVDFFTGAALQEGLGGLLHGGAEAPAVVPVEPTQDGARPLAPRDGAGGKSVQGAAKGKEDCKQQ